MFICSAVFAGHLQLCVPLSITHDLLLPEARLTLRTEPETAENPHAPRGTDGPLGLNFDPRNRDQSGTPAGNAHGNEPGRGQCV